MSITKESELAGMKKISEAVAITLKQMRNYSQPGMTAKQVDDFGAEILNSMGAKSAWHTFREKNIDGRRFNKH